MAGFSASGTDLARAANRWSAVHVTRKNSQGTGGMRIYLLVILSSTPASRIEEPSFAGGSERNARTTGSKTQVLIFVCGFRGIFARERVGRGQSYGHGSSVHIKSKQTTCYVTICCSTLAMVANVVFGSLGCQLLTTVFPGVLYSQRQQPAA